LEKLIFNAALEQYWTDGELMSIARDWVEICAPARIIRTALPGAIADLQLMFEQQ
jgi:hypothetical protein